MNFNEVIQSKNFVVLDTETTGLHDGEIVQIAIIDSAADVLVNTLVKPVYPIPREATAIHGIDWETVKSAPTWPDVVPSILEMIEGSNVIVYNAVYDRRMMYQSCEAARMPRIEWGKLAPLVLCDGTLCRTLGRLERLSPVLPLAASHQRM